jgi:hypothetical protein
MTGSFNKTTMKFKLFLFALLALLMASCAREPLPEPNIEQEGKLVTIRATIPSDTKVSYEDSNIPGNGGTLAWESGDQLMLVGYDDNGAYKGHNVFTFQTGSSGNFTGEAVSGATKYKAYFPADAVSFDSNNNVLFNNVWQQTQDGNNSTAHLGDKLGLCDESGHGLDQLFTLAAKNNILRLNLSNIPDTLGTIKKVIWTVAPTPATTRSTILDVTNFNNINYGESMTFYLAFDPSVMKIAAGGCVKITLIGNRSYEWVTSVNNDKNYAQGNTRYYASVNSGWNKVSPMMYSIRTDVANTEHGIWQTSASSNSPADLTIYWGDGSVNEAIGSGNPIAQKFASHTYASVGDYTVIIVSDETSYNNIQIPNITFNKQVTQEDLLTAVLTPFPYFRSNRFHNSILGMQQISLYPW